MNELAPRRLRARANRHDSIFRELPGGGVGWAANTFHANRERGVARFTERNPLAAPTGDDLVNGRADQSVIDPTVAASASAPTIGGQCWHAFSS